MVRALSDELSKIADPGSIVIQPRNAGRSGLDFSCSAYDFRWRLPGETDVDEAGVCRMLGYLRRKFLEGLRTGRKIYVSQRRRPLQLAQAAALLMELNRLGRATLLCVEQAPPDRRPGEVRLLMPDLMVGYVSHFAPPAEVEKADPADWPRMLANAASLHRAPGLKAAA